MTSSDMDAAMLEIIRRIKKDSLSVKQLLGIAVSGTCSCRPCRYYVYRALDAIDRIIFSLSEPIFKEAWE